MTAPLAHRLATYLLAVDGLIALRLAGLVGVLGAGLVAVALLACWWRGERGTLAVSPTAGRAAVALAAVASAVDLAYFAESLLDGFVRLLLFLLLYRLVTRRSLRDARDVSFLSFFMLVAASSVTFDVAFLFVFLAFLLLSVWSLMLHHVLDEAGRVAAVAGPGAGGQAPLGPALLALSLAASAATLAITAVFFLVIPRVGQAALPLRVRLGAMVSGFSEHVELGAFGQIESDASVVMRVRLPDGPAHPELLPALRWRGIALDRFDGRAWSASRPGRAPRARSAAGRFDVNRRRGTGLPVTQEIYLEPIGTEVIFAASRLVELQLPGESIMVDDTGSVSVAAPSARLRYVAYSELEPTPGRGGRGPSARLDADSRERYLQLPALSPRVLELARAVGEGGGDSAGAAARLTSFLSREFRYSLALSRETSLDPLEEFLLVRRSGNCEYFATALAVMLRSIGIPARLVNGFQRGEWNPYGQYFMVRQRDAHSWVEAHIEGVGWVALDPSPRGDSFAPGGPGRAGLYLDSLRLRWYRYVVNWSLRDQVSVAAALQRETVFWRERLARAGSWTDIPRIDARLVVLLVAGVGVGLWLLRRRRSSGARPGAPVPEFYARALRILARRRLRPEPAETAREFLARVGSAAPLCAAPLSRLTAGYELARFGSSAPTADGARELGVCLARLARTRGE